ncbi:Methyl-accepting chemotaxis sensor/transducer protein [hydrothermal vent metagenome]|uniref:histidine kinase n=1 Tax=hydrothermal vent metagenome TaxID=652676 RepID=A0A3B1CEF7_9ZZZZ
MKKPTVRKKLIALFLLVGVAPFMIAGVIVVRWSANSFSRQAYNQLTSLREVKAEAIRVYFDTIELQIIAFSGNRMVVDATRDFSEYTKTFLKESATSKNSLETMRAGLLGYYENDFAQEYIKRNDGQKPEPRKYFAALDEPAIALQYYYISANKNRLGQKQMLDQAPDNSRYSRLHGRFHRFIRDYFGRFGFYDIFLVDAGSGRVLYSMFKELDFATSLIDGPFASSNLGEVYRKAMAIKNDSDIVFTDYAAYQPSYGDPAGFIASPVFNEGQKIGIAIFQIPLTQVNAIMTSSAGMGETGETYLVGRDLLLRSDSRLEKGLNVFTSFQHRIKADSVAVRAALSGETGTREIEDYRGRQVLSAYAPLDVLGSRWAFLAEIDVDEALKPGGEIKYVLILAIVSSIGISAVMGLIISGSISRRVETLSQAAKEMAVGELDHRVKIKGSDELSGLGDAFNRMAEKLSRSYADLERHARKLSERGDKLEEEVIVRRKIEENLRSVNHEMESFIYSVSHDLKAPIVTVQGMTNLLVTELGGNLSEDCQIYMKHIKDATIIMSHLLDDLQEISRVGRMNIEPEVVDMNDLMEQILAEGEIAAKDRGIEFRFQQDLPTVYANPKRVYQVFTNLVGNAIKFMPADVPSPRVEVGGMKTDGGMAEFFVQDNGAGIEPRFHKKIFDLFTRLHGRDVKGTGMGLAFVKKIIESIGGSVGVDSAHGGGARFYFTIPGSRK